MLSDVKRFSETSLRYIQKLSELYSLRISLPQLGEESDESTLAAIFSLPSIDEIEKELLKDTE